MTENGETQKPVYALKEVFQKLTDADLRLSKILPKNNPYAGLLGQKILDVMLLLRFVIDMEQAEIDNPVQVAVREKSQEENSDGANLKSCQ